MRSRFGPSRAFRSVRNAALDALFPPRCAGCETWLEGEAWRVHPFCATCRRQITPPPLPWCERCGTLVPAPAPVCPECDDLTWPKSLKRVRATGWYEGPLRAGIHLFKYRGQWALAEGLSNHLVAWCAMQPSAPAPIPIKNLALIVPIPMHPWRQWRRGYNQSALLAAHLSQKWNVPTAPLLRRTRYTPPQVSMNGDARRSNMGGVFALCPKERLRWQGVLDRPILLLDDVFTTGTTLRACAQMLQNAGAQEIYALALARAGDHQTRS